MSSESERDALRERIRAGEFRRTTTGLCPGSVQANLVILPSAYAAAFRRFCERNPRPCPLIEETSPGETVAAASAPSADLRTDAPLYRVYREGELVDEPADIRRYWSRDLVAFLLGCSFTFERALLEAGISLRHQEERKTVPMYVTNRPCKPAGIFAGPLVVSMRPVAEALVSKARQVTERFPSAHGAPLHAGDPAAIGIEALERPDFGEAVTVRDFEVPLFWACGVTPQAVARSARPELLITHAPGHMFLTDLDEPDFGSYN